MKFLLFLLLEMENITTPNVSDSYTSISAPSQGSYKDRGSKFLSFAYHVDSEEEIKSIISKYKKDYYDARHVCFAYRLGRLGERWRMNDDGEPSSTAGKPIYGQILSAGLSDILIIVVRYFGGTKLGVPGLIKAYKSAAADSIINSTTVTIYETSDFIIKFEYKYMNNVMKLLKELHIVPSMQECGLDCEMKVQVRLSDQPRFREMLENIATLLPIN